MFWTFTHKQFSGAKLYHQVSFVYIVILCQAEKQMLEKSLQTEKARAIEGERKSKEAQKKDEEVRKLMSQLETVKVGNSNKVWL